MVGAIAPGTMDVGSDFFLSVFPREKSLEIHTVSAWAAAGWEFGILPRWPPRPRSLSPVGAATQAAASDSSGRAGPAMRPQTRPAQVEFAQDRQRSRGALEVSPVMGSLFRHFGFSHVKFHCNFFFLVTGEVLIPVELSVNCHGRSTLQLILLDTRVMRREEYLRKQYGRLLFVVLHAAGRCCKPPASHAGPASKGSPRVRSVLEKVAKWGGQDLS
ncbi:hypothetical protein GQ55_9G478900 [Panicum hallii var. hallii]|uniref:Uncharacterized protein n=1 Tax=Panicum hallii var. hallii TaxID=1504633 RepID=A0A2T7CCR9_9POAL|nr:hypothetical protein GQ55_9G478900 [Panicum hallii var. hallii]